MEPRPARERLSAFLEPVFGVDLRSLGLFRIGLASVLLWDLFDRSRSVEAHYTELGTVPVTALSLVTHGAKLSIHAWLSASLFAQWALLALSFAAAVALLLGYRTRLAALLSWGLLSSLQVRNPLVSWEGADNLVRILLLWSALAPVGARLSLDARRRGVAFADRLCTPATALLVIQILAIYWITGMSKTGDNWRNGMALAYALRVDFFGSALGVWMRQHDAALTLLTHTTRFLELGAPFLLLVPVHTWAFRLAAMALFYGFHVGILLLMGVGYFSPVSMVMWLPLVPGLVWDRLGALRRRAAPGVGPPLATPRLVEAAAVCFCIFVAASIASRAVGFLTPWRAPLPAPVELAGRLLRVNQYWPMFSPEPPPFDLWPVMEGRLAGGQRVDAFRGGPVTRQQPDSVAAYFPTFKWKIHLWWLGHKSWEAQEPHLLWSYLADHLCRRWNREHEGSERMVQLDVLLQVEEIRPRGEDRVIPWKVLDRYACPG